MAAKSASLLLFSHANLKSYTVAGVVNLILMSMCGIPASAQQTNPGATAIELPQIVVSATTLPTPMEQVGSSVTVITAAEIERDQRRTASDVLATAPGLNVVQNGGPGGVTSVFMRGTNPNHTKIFIDGIDVSDPSNPGRVFDLGQLLTADIERIEVLRGPQSGLYGADALGGVISITTKKGAGPTKITGTVEGGSFGTFNQAAQVSGSTENVNYAFTASHFQSANTPVTPQELLQPGQRAIGNYYDNSTYSTKLGADLSENFSLNFVGRYTDAKLRFTGDDFSGFPLVFPASEQSTQVNHQGFARGEAVWSMFDGKFKNHFGVAYSDLWSWNFDPNLAPTTSVNKGDRTKYDWRGYVTVMPGHVVLLGLEQETERLHTDTDNAQNSNKGAYVELQSELAKRFFMVANVRHDDNERFGGATTWRVAPAYLVPITETKLKASYGTGFKAPTLTQLFVDFPSFGFFANRNLRPETSTGYDFGFEQPIANDRIRFGATWYHNDIKNLITYNSTFTSNENIGLATTYGVEAFASAAVTTQVKLRSDYTYTVAKNDITGEELLRRPKHKASISAVWTPNDQLTLTSTVLYVSSWNDIDRFGMAPAPFATQPYTLVNLAGNYVVNKNLTAFARIDNLFNHHYQNPVGFERPGFGAFGGIRMTN
jgi:vitamin B12 transporter